MTAGGVVSFEFIVDLRWRVQGFFQIVSSAKRCRAIDLIDIADFFRNVEVSRFVVLPAGPVLARIQGKGLPLPPVSRLPD